MEKYTKHFMEIAFTKLEFDDFFFEEHQIEARDSEFLNKYFFDEELIKSLIEGEYYSKRYVVKYPTFITSGRPLAKIRFYDINYIVDDDLVYESEKHIIQIGYVLVLGHLLKMNYLMEKMFVLMALESLL